MRLDEAVLAGGEMISPIHTDHHRSHTHHRPHPTSPFMSCLSVSLPPPPPFRVTAMRCPSARVVRSWAAWSTTLSFDQHRTAWRRHTGGGLFPS